MFFETDKQNKNTICHYKNEKGKETFIEAITNDEEKKNKKTFNEKIFDNKADPCFFTFGSRKIHVIFGASGCGKSTYTSELIKSYKALYKNKRQIYFLSMKDYDPVIDKFNVLRLKIDKIIENPPSLEMCKNSLWIWDDTEALPKQVKDQLYGFMSKLLTVGRSFECDMIITAHVLSGTNKFDKLILIESHLLTCFFGSNFQNVAMILRNYNALTQKQILKLKAENNTLKSRWTTFFRNYPMFYFSQKNCKKLD